VIKQAYNLLIVRSIEALFGQCLFLSLQSLELGLDIGVDEIGNILSVVDLGNDIVFPRVVGKDVVF
jgi:hypothetical protein